MATRRGLLLPALVLASAMCVAAAADTPVTEKIVGGKESKPFVRSYVVFVVIRDGDYAQQCGGSLLAPEGKVVLTAAHCSTRYSSELSAAKLPATVS